MAYQKYKLNEKIPDDALESGGTEISSVLNYVNEKHPNLTIVLTDGFFGLPDIKVPKSNEMLWVISKNGNTDTTFLNSLPGKHIKMK
jgi:predicted metal-dependent peptidase